MIPSAKAGTDAARLLSEVGHLLNVNEYDALARIQAAATYRLPISRHEAELAGSAMRKRDATGWGFGA